ncbi:hypothetical protein H4Q26_000309 [Puccinia striiformis f. sp. tritici PST-130]|nr:hypothetical protein H4Q26_000309 [Puccinia striiformis f. sp. tritici PST-130]
MLLPAQHVCTSLLIAPHLLVVSQTARPLDHSITTFTGLSDIQSPPSFGLGVLVAQMNPPGFDIGSGVPAGLPSRGWNERALNSSLVDQTLSSLTATGLNTTPSLNTTAINPSNTTTTATTPTTTSTQRPHLFEDDDDDDDGLPGLMMDDPPDGDQPETKGPKDTQKRRWNPSLRWILRASGPLQITMPCDDV